MKKILLLLLAACPAFFAIAQKSPKREMRGAWISTHLGLDWPVGSQTPAQQRAALVSYLDEQKQTGINAIFFQVRSQADALYPSQIEPWAYVLNGNSLTGRQDVDPGWDPLQFALDETHKRGMEFHAWLNPYRAVATASQLGTARLFTAKHVAKRKPEWLINTGSIITVDPAIPAVRDYIIDVIEEVVNNYDIDGLHFDDYFYPTGMTLALDQNSYNTYATATEKIQFPNNATGRADWRRENVNRLIQQVQESVSALKPWVKFGVSPTGIYRNVSASFPTGSDTRGSEHYTSVYADSRKWLEQGWVDYIAPQLYWHIGFYPVADYAVLVPWWNNNAFGKHVYIGMASYKVNMTFPATGNGPVEQAAWKIPSQYPNELRMNRDAAYENVLGELHFRVAFLRANALGHRDSIRQNIYKKQALLPVMNYKNVTQPGSPSDVVAEKNGSSYELSWEPPSPTTDAFRKVRQYAIYRSGSPVFNLEDTAYLLAVTDTDVTTYTDHTADPSKTYYYAVTALNRLHVESAAAITDLLPPVITCPGLQTVSVDENCSFTLPDYRALAAATDDISTASQITITQHPAAGTVVSGKGAHTITLTATDASGKQSSCTFTVTALDELPPVISNTTVDPSVLFPANHKMRNIQVGYTATDNCGPVSTTLSVTSNEAEDATGDGETEKDWEVVDAHKLKLRAERSGSGEGRIYTITITATDGSGNQSVQTLTVTVPHDRSDLTQRPSGTAKETIAPHLVVTAQQNPVRYSFRIHTLSSAAAALNIRVVDVAGRVVETRSGVASNGSFELGRGFRAGVYFLQVTQGSTVQTIRLVKTAD